MELWHLEQLSDDELVERIDALTDHGAPQSDLLQALDVLFSRVRPVGERQVVEAKLGLLKEVLEADDDDDDTAGVREPRRQPPGSDAGAVQRPH